MFYVYILYSKQRNKFYVGYTGDDLQERIRKHNMNHKGFTGKTRDWELKYFEKFDTKKETMQREIEIKRWKSRVKIMEIISKSINE